MRLPCILRGSPAVWIGFLSLIISNIAYPQAPDTLRAGNVRRENFTLSSGDTLIRLSHEFVIEGTDTVYLNGAHLIRTVEYSLNPRYGTLKLRSGIAPNGQKSSLTVTYHYYPFNFRPSYSHRIPMFRRDTLTGRSEQVAKPVSSFNMDDLFGSNLQKSGSIVRGFTLGTNRDLSLSSGFRMQMSGKISENTEVIAALTDENIPLQPEGTTQTLQEVDKVFVEIHGPNLSATLGDFVLGISGSEFGSFSRKLQGAKGNAVYRNNVTNGEATVSAATTRGKYTTNQIQGLDAVQGPYPLTGQDNSRDIIVIAGTERVYLDGELMVRGENNDYTIDYSIGEITFTPHRLISRVSRITVDYEYTDRQFSRNLLAVQTGNKFFGDKLSIRTMLMQEKDDKDSPTELVFTDTDRAILAAAGGNRLNAVRSGIDSVGQGKGQYIKVDTMLAKPGASTLSATTIYRYAPQDSINARYAITFSFVGSGAGDYNRVAAGQYAFAGVHMGSYAPVRFLPLPESHSMTNITADWQILPSLKIAAEGAFSGLNLNQFSSLAGAQTSGGALNATVNFAQDSITLAGLNIGALQLSAHERRLDNNFNPIDRINEAEFARNWNLENVLTGTEQLHEGNAIYSPLSTLHFNAGIGELKKGDLLTTNRYTAGGTFKNEHMQSAEYNLDILKTGNLAAGSNTDWIRDRAQTEAPLGFVTPGIRYSHEYRRETGAASDTGFFGSFRFHEITPGLTFPNILGMRLLGEFGLRTDDSLFAGTLTRASKTTTEYLEFQPPSTEDFSSSMSLTFRDRKFTDLFRFRNNPDANTTLLRLQARYTPLKRGIETDWFYDASSERSAKEERVFQQVAKGAGNYIYLGDLNNNHIQDESEFQLARFDGNYISFLVPSTQFVPVTDVKASSRIRINGNRLFASEDAGGILSQLSSETSLRVNEKSSLEDTKQIYLLHLSRFLNDQTTLEGSNEMTQDLYFRENNPEFSLRLHFNQKMSYTQFSLQNERAYARDQSIRIKWHLIEEIANQIDAGYRVDNLSATQLSYRVRQVSGSTLAMDWSYRPEQRYELGFKFGVGRLTNADTTNANLNDQSVRFTYSMETKGQLRAEFDREEALIDHSGLVVPYELTMGRISGKTWLWRLAFDYRMTQFIQATINYDGRSENGGSPIHTGRAEVKAFF